MVIGILIRPGTAAARLYKSEAREEKIKPSITNTVKTIWWIYLLYTIIGIVLYLLAGMPLLMLLIIPLPIFPLVGCL